MAAIAKIGKEEHKLRVYTFPARGNQAEDFHLMVNGVKLDSTRARTTSGGGKDYTYIKADSQKDSNQAFWMPGLLASGTAVTITETADEPKAAPAAKAVPAAAAPVAKPAPAAKPVAKRPGGK